MVTVPGVALTRVMVSEWLKFRSVRSSVTGIALSAVVLVGVGLITCLAMADDFVPGRPLDVDGPPFLPTTPVGATLSGVVYAQLIVAGLGVVFVSAEYATGMIRATVAAVPARSLVLAAKSLVLGGVLLGVMLVSSFAAFVAGSAVFGDSAAAPSLGDPEVLRAVVATPVYLAGVGVLAIALTVILRSAAITISLVSFVLFLLDSLLGLLMPASMAETVLPYLPASAGKAFMATASAPDLLSPWAGFAVFCAYIAIALIGAAVVLRRRDL